MLRTTMILGLAGAMSIACLAQSTGSTPAKEAAQTAESAPQKFYRLDFVVRELENEHVINSRSYSMIARTGYERGAIRAGANVPFNTSSTANSNWQQIHVGVNVDYHGLQEIGDRVSLNVRADVSSVVEGHGENSPPPSQPVVRDNIWESWVVLPMRQPTILFSSDDPASKRKMQLQLMVTPVR